jgi:Ca2+:H+ antiporter
MSSWSWWVPVAALGLLATSLLLHITGTGVLLADLAALIGAVMAAVHHAEVIAHRVGEPFGTVVLSIAVTIIEVSLLVSTMLAGGPDKAALPRDTIFAVIMLTLNGLVGLSMLIGALRHGEQAFQVMGANASLATVITLSSLSLVLPGFTVSSPGPTYTPTQLIFASVASVLLWAAFVFVQTVRHRDYFLPVQRTDAQSHAPQPTTARTLASLGMLLVALTAVVGLAHEISPDIEAAVVAAHAPRSVVSIAIAALTLLPEGLAAVQASRADRLQTSLNLAIGGAIASIGLTIPAVSACSLLLGLPLVLGLEGKELVLLSLTFLIASFTLVAGRTHVLLGIVHLVILAAFLFFSVIP